MLPGQKLSDEQKRLLFYAALLLITLAGLSLRLYKLNDESLWLDEAIAYKAATRFTVRELLSGEQRVIGSPPLHYLVLKLWMRFAGITSGSARLLSALLGAGTVLLLGLCTEELFGRPSALLGTLLLSFSATHVYFSQEVRMYALLGVEAVLSLYLIARLQRDNRQRDLLFLTVVNAAGLYTHYYYAFTLVAQAAAAALCQRRTRILLLASLMLSGLVYLPFGLTVADSELALGMAGHSRSFGRADLLSTAEELTGVLPAPLLPFYRGIPRGLEMAVFVSAALTMAIAALRNRNDTSLRILLFYVIMPFFALKGVELLIGPFHQNDFAPRYFFAVLPPLLILLARSLTLAPRLLAGSVLLLLLLANAAALSAHFAYATKEDWRGAASALYPLLSPETPIIVAPDYVAVPLSVYLPNVQFARNGLSVRLRVMPMADTSPGTLAKLPDELLLVVSFRHLRDTDADGALLRYLAQEYDPLDEQLFWGEIMVMRARRKAAP